ncbi:thioredoxin-like protein [Lactifluus subvellereus]|nr:thioredoxin-like protein [Lactifluus subvellereus]
MGPTKRWGGAFPYCRSNKTFGRVTSATRTNERVVLVDFYADWCGPCKVLSPILEKLAEDADVKTGSGRPIDLVTVDTDEHSALAQKYQVRALPTVVAFRDGQPINQFVGALPESGEDEQPRKREVLLKLPGIGQQEWTFEESIGGGSGGFKKECDEVLCRLIWMVLSN